MSARVTIDLPNKVGYVLLSNSPVVNSVEAADLSFVVDLEESCKVVGVELLSLQRVPTISEIQAIAHVRNDDVERLDSALTQVKRASKSSSSYPKNQDERLRQKT